MIFQRKRWILVGQWDTKWLRGKGQQAREGGNREEPEEDRAQTVESGRERMRCLKAIDSKDLYCRHKFHKLLPIKKIKK